METVLNIVWLLVACGMFAAYATSGRKAHYGVLTLLCVAVLLFPIISVTDDMATDTTIIEEWSALRRPSLILITIVLTTVAETVPMATLIERSARAAHLVCAGAVEIPALVLLTSSFATVWSFRPPPFALA